ncbi:MAG TPA: hypothetical protein VK644_12325, partial [Chitinophagaceae bacterium]|nr:hypothetical protein [Chitinophagaceae bacterium]
LPGKNQAVNIEKNISGKTFTMQANDMHLQSMSFMFTNGVCRLMLKTDTALYDLGFNLNKWKLGETTKHGPYLSSHAKNNLTGLPPFRIAGAYRWKEENVLELTLRYLETPHTQRFICRFDDKNNLVVTISNSLFASDILHVKGIGN